MQNQLRDEETQRQASRSSNTCEVEHAPEDNMGNRMRRQLGVFGPRNSGKTTFWTCLFGSKGTGDGSASFTDESTVRQLDSLWRSLAEGSVVPATAQGEPQDLVFCLHSKGTTWDVSTKDYSGVLVELSGMPGQASVSGTKELRNRIVEWVRNCDALLVLVPADLAEQDEHAKLLFRRAMEVLLEVFNSSDHPGPLPVGLAITKADMLSAQPDRYSASADVTSRALPPWMEDLVNLVQHQVGKEHVRVFWTSAFGGHADHDSKLPPDRGPRPRGLEEPLLWAMQQSDCCLYSAAGDQARTILRQRWLPRLRKGLQGCQRVLAKGLPAETNQVLLRLRDQLDVRLRKQRRRRWTASAIVAVVAIFSGLYLHADAFRCRPAQAEMVTGRLTRESVSAVESFLGSTNPAAWFFHRDCRKRAQEWLDVKADGQTRGAREALRRDHDDPSQHWQSRIKLAESRVHTCESYVALFPSRVPTQEFQRETDKAGQLIKELQRYGPFDDAYVECIRAISSCSTSGEMEPMKKQFIAEHPRTNYPLRGSEYDRLDDMIKAKQADETISRLTAGEATIRANYNKDPTLYTTHLRDIDAWFKDYDANKPAGMDRLAEELRQLRRGIATDWDTNDYAKLRTAAGRMFEGNEQRKNAIKYAEDYVDANRNIKTMKTYVDDWKAYAKEIEKTRRVGITVREIDVNGSKFEDTTGGEEIKVVILAGPDGQEWQLFLDTGAWTRLEKGHRGPISTEAKYITVPLTHRLKVTVEELDWWLDPNDRGAVVGSFLGLLEDQKVGANSMSAFIDVEGAKVTVELKDLPVRKDLPEYEKPQY